MRTARALLAAAGVAAFVVLAALPAAAHVTIPEPATKGASDALVTLSVPNEMDNATTVKVEVRMPTDVTLGSVSPQAKPGWTITTTTRHLPTPITTDDGQVTDVVDTVTWSGGSIPAGQFDTFTLSVGPLPTNKDQLTFPTLQTYSNGQVVSWIDVQPQGGPEPDHPQPVLHLVAGPSATTTTPSATTKGSSSSSGKGIAVAALAVALVALVVGGAGATSARRRAAG